MNTCCLQESPIPHAEYALCIQHGLNKLSAIEGFNRAEGTGIELTAEPAVLSSFLNGQLLYLHGPYVSITAEPVGSRYSETAGIGSG